MLNGEWCNGSTADSGSACLGSNPSSPAHHHLHVNTLYKSAVPIWQHFRFGVGITLLHAIAEYRFKRVRVQCRAKYALTVTLLAGLSRRPLISRNFLAANGCALSVIVCLLWSIRNEFDVTQL